ncbi:heme transporter hrg1-A-like [Liolophura sinensis]|uniref:heme transporter hrg1-A-like n=1 Tax=Liolophura sinensis TaxID=3198878 RepID=UPI003159420C
MAAPTTGWFRCRIIFAIIGVIVGLSVFIVFATKFYNWNTALWGLLSGVGALITLIVHLLYRKGVWQTYSYRLRYYMLLGCFLQLAGVCGFVTYLSLGIVQKQVLTPYGNGFYLTCVWCFMTWKWGFSLFYYSRSYKQEFSDVYTIVAKEDSVYESDPLISD